MKASNNISPSNNIYHYTKFDNLLSILKEDKFKFSDFNNANDYKEKSAIRRKNEIEKFKYISFTQNKELESYSYTNPPLWYFYANRNNGACICFDKDKLLAAIKPIKEGNINYERGVSRIDMQSTKDYLMEKSKAWSYEDEYRIIVDASCEDIPKITEYIKSIYIGEAVSDDDVRKILEYLPQEIELYQMYIDSNDGRLQHTDFRQKCQLVSMVKGI